MVSEYRSKPYKLKAIQYNGDNIKEVLEFVGLNNIMSNYTVMLVVYTRNGWVKVYEGDWVAKKKGEIFVVDRDTFDDLYEKVEE